jgi:hypothetical protein
MARNQEKANVRAPRHPAHTRARARLGAALACATHSPRGGARAALRGRAPQP